MCSLIGPRTVDEMLDEEICDRELAREIEKMASFYQFSS